MNEAKKKQKAVRKLLDEERNTEIPIHSPFKKKYPDLSTSFVRRRSGMIQKLLTMKPATAIPILKHVWDQLYKKTRNAGSNEPILAERYPFACPHVPYW